MAATQTVRIIPMTLLCLMLLTSSASAGCAWVLWEQVSSTGERSDLKTEHRIVAARPTEGECRAFVAQTAKGRAAQWGPSAKVSNENSSVFVAVEKTAIKWDYRCLPDTIDPRGPKGK